MKEQQEATFEKLAYETIQYLEHEWTNHKTAKQWESSLKAYAFPVIGQFCFETTSIYAIRG